LDIGTIIIGILIAFVVVAITTTATAIIVPMTEEAYAQGKPTYPKINEEEWIEVNPGERYNCPECKMIFQGTEFTIWEHGDGNRVVVAVPITDNSTLQDEGFAYNYCFIGVKHAIDGLCDADYEKYKGE
jgi:hypothetical protein